VKYPFNAFLGAQFARRAGIWYKLWCKRQMGSGARRKWAVRCPTI